MPKPPPIETADLRVALPPRPVVRVRTGVVVSLDPPLCEVTIGGTTVDAVPYLLEPAVDDVVVLLQDGASFTVLGTIGQTASGGGGGGATTLNALTDVTLTSPADGAVLTYDTGSGQWIDAVPAATSYVRDTASITTSSIADDADDTGTVELAAGYRLLRFSCDRACRVRLYATGAQRTADASRPIGTDVDIATDHGLVFEFVAEAAVSDYDLSPTVDGSPPTGDDVYWRITNLSGSTHTVDVDLEWLRTE